MHFVRLAEGEVDGVVDEHQICHLFDNVQRIGQTACPEDLPKAVNLTFNFSGNHYRFSSFQV